MIEMVRIRRLELTFAPQPWPFAEARHDEIVRHFDRLKQVKPAIWNGRVLLLHDSLNADKIYFPTGVPDPSDIVGGMVDLAASVRREMAEETGLHADAYEAEEGWYCVLAKPHIAHFKMLRAHDTAVALCARIRAHLAREVEPELADVRIVRGPPDLDPMMMPLTVTTFLTHIWSQASQRVP